jgi:hypothetical protein
MFGGSFIPADVLRFNRDVSQAPPPLKTPGQARLFQSHLPATYCYPNDAWRFAATFG